MFLRVFAIVRIRHLQQTNQIWPSSILLPKDINFNTLIYLADYVVVALLL
jgi:hypothetical protein